MIGHVIPALRNSNLCFPGGIFIHSCIYSFHMPFMFMIAGYAHGMKEHFSSGQKYSLYLMKSIIDLYFPCLYFSFMYWFLKYFLLSNSSGNIENFRTATIQSLFNIPFLGFNEYWFLCTLFFIKTLHLFYERNIKYDILHSLLWIFMFASLNAFMGIIPLFFRQLIYGLYFHMGFMMKRHIKITGAKLSLGITLFLAGTACFIASYFYGLGNIFIRTGASVFTSVGLFIIFYALNISNKFLVKCGVYSMVIYCLHIYIASFLRIIYRFTGLSYSANAFILFILTALWGVLLSLIVVWLYKNVKCLNWIEYIFYPGRMKRAPLE